MFFTIIVQLMQFEILIEFKLVLMYICESSH